MGWNPFSIGKETGEAIASPITAIGNVFDKLFTSDDERLGREEMMVRLVQQPHLAQAEINKLEAQHRSLLVAGWRPAIGWVCSFGLGQHFIINPWLSWIGQFTAEVDAQGNVVSKLLDPPVMDVNALLTLTTALLGLGGMRMFEKLKGRAK